MTKLSRAALSCAFVLAFCSVSHAAIVTLDFTATVYNIRVNNASEQISIGEAVIGSVSYDTAIAAQGPAWTSDHRSYVFAGNSFIRANIGGLHFSEALTYVEVLNRHSLDRFYVSNEFNLSTNNFAHTVQPVMGLWVDGFQNSSSGLLTSVELPLSAPDMSFADLGQDAPLVRETSPFFLTAGNLEFSAWLDKLTTRQASIPEPGTLALLALGLAGVGWVRRKQ